MKICNIIRYFISLFREILKGSREKILGAEKKQPQKEMDECEVGCKVITYEEFEEYRKRLVNTKFEESLYE